MNNRDPIEVFNKMRYHNEEMRVLGQQTNKLEQVAEATNKLASNQQQANILQKETNTVLQKQCDELMKRNAILESELKSSNKQNKISVGINVASIAIALASLIVAIIALVIV